MATLSPQLSYAADDFEVLRELGCGAMGRVQLARFREGFAQRVALKTMRSRADDLTRRSFEHEARALAAIDHPGVVRGFGRGQHHDGRPFLVLEYVEGIDLESYCREHRLSIHERLELFLQVCEAVQAVHEAGFVHRDLKPDNVLVYQTPQGPVAKLIDFGLSADLDSSAEDDFVGSLVGTPAYMSPEQADPSRAELGPQSDVYALGALLYRLLTGAIAIPEEALTQDGIAGMRQAILERVPAAPSAFVELGSARTAVDAVVMKALAKRQIDRYATAAEFGEDLFRALFRIPVLALQPTDLAPRNSGGILRQARRVGLAAAAGVMLALGAQVFSHTGSGNRSQAPSEAMRAMAAKRLDQETEASILGGLSRVQSSDSTLCQASEDRPGCSENSDPAARLKAINERIERFRRGAVILTDESRWSRV